MHFTDDVLKTKFLAVYVPYQERLFHVDHEIRDLTNQYVQAYQQTLSDAEAAKFLPRGLKLQNERNEILHNYIEKPKRTVPPSLALRAWEVENKLRAQASALRANSTGCFCESVTKVLDGLFAHVFSDARVVTVEFRACGSRVW